MKTVGLPARPQASGIDSRLVGRDATMDELANMLAKGNTPVALTANEKAVAMHGHGGIGKTALAIEYCHARARSDRFALVLWVNADSDATTAESMRDILRHHAVDFDDTDLLPTVCRFLATKKRWLMVFDNVGDKSTFDQWSKDLPTSGQVLLTTRSDQGTWPRSLAVDVIPDDDARGWLLSAAGNPTESEELSAADELVKRFEGLALGLSMATAYIVKGTKLSRYLELFDTDASKLLGRTHTAADGYDKTVYSALAVARDRLRQDDADAAVLMLEYASFYAPDMIPLRLFSPDALGVESDAEVTNAMHALAERSLIRIEDGAEHFSVHRLIQEVTRYYLKHPPKGEQPVEAPVVKPTAPAEQPTQPPIEVKVVDERKNPVLERLAWVAAIAAAVLTGWALLSDGDDEPEIDLDPAPVTTSSTSSSSPTEPPSEGE